MELHVTNLRELAELVSVLDLARLSALTGVPLRYMPTDNLGADTTELEALQQAHRHGGPVSERMWAISGAPEVVVPEPEPAGSPPLTRDSAGLPHDTRIHSDPPKTNKDGTWRARRGVDDATVEAVTAELRAAIGDASAPEDDAPVATEVHALPVDAPEDDAPAAGADVASVDLGLLLLTAKDAAGDASDSLQDLLVVAKEFITQHGVAAMNAVKAHAVPAAAGNDGKPLPAMSPAERRLFRACLDNYALFA